MTYRCVLPDCRKTIDKLRAQRAIDRGQTPTYCSDECSTRGGNRNAYYRRQERKKNG